MTPHPPHRPRAGKNAQSGCGMQPAAKREGIRWLRRCRCHTRAPVRARPPCTPRTRRGRSGGLPPVAARGSCGTGARFCRCLHGGRDALRLSGGLLTESSRGLAPELSQIFDIDGTYRVT
eukprot:112216-Rhodomonas_salina.3